ncbi:MAG: PKD domain-containing protein [Euryarchaeota archaeon]|nr:PKD domain-containing protein [Euryarchaeota archaeon]
MRDAASMVYDPADGTVVLFGGYFSGLTQADTWEYHGGVWYPVDSPISPPARYAAAMVYDIPAGYVLLFGGQGAGTSGSLQDTWEFSGGTWVQLTSTSSPGTRYGATMTYDAADGYVVLFGGFGCSTGSGCVASLLQDTWQFSGGAWTQLTPTTSPGTRYDASMTYDTADGYVVLFGGLGCSTGSGCAANEIQDTWKFTGTTWTQLSILALPGARNGASMTYDGADGYVVLFGGYGCFTGSSCGLHWLQETWKLMGTTWTLLTPAASPGIREGATMTYDVTDGYVVLFGGHGPGSAGGLQDTWKFSGGTWAQLAPTTSPGTRTGATMTFDVRDGYVVLFGGFGCSTGSGCTVDYLQDTWKFTGTTWTQLSPTTSPGTRLAASMVYDSADRYVALFGGYGCSTGSGCAVGYLQDTWKFTGTTWTQLTPATSPGTREYASMTYDAADGYVVLFGGYGCYTGSSCTVDYLQDTWQFTGTTWSQFAPTTSPGTRYDASMTYDTADGYVMLFGGFGCSTACNWLQDTWSFGIPLTDATPSASPSSLDVGQALLLTSSATGGGQGASHEFGWWGLPPGCSTAVLTVSVSCTPSKAGTYYVGTVVSESNGIPLATGPTTTVTVYPDPSATASGSASSRDAGQTVTLTGLTSGGLGPFSGIVWNGLPTASSCAAAGSLTCAITLSSSGVGQWTITVSATDANGFTATSMGVALTVDPALCASPCGISGGTSLDVGQTATVQASVNGGTGTYSYAWSALSGAGCPTTSASTVDCTPTATGSFTVAFVATDTNGATTAALGVVLTVSADPTITAPTASRATLDVGQATTLTTTDAGGSGTLVVSWSGLPTGCLSSNTLSFSCSPTAVGTFTVYANVQDTHLYNATSGPLTVVVSPRLNPGGSFASPASLDLGQATTFVTNVNGGTGSYSYGWMALPPGCAAADTGTLVCTPTATGSFLVTVSVVDSNNNLVSPAAIALTVGPDPVAGSLVASLRGLPQLGSASAPLTLGSTPSWVLYDPGNGMVYVGQGNCCGAGNTVWVVNPSTGTLVKTITTGNLPISLAYDSARGEVFVAEYGNAQVQVIDDSTNALVATIPMPDEPLSLGYDSWNGDVYVALYATNRVAVIDGATDSIVSLIGVGSGPNSAAFDPATGDVWVGDQNGAAVTIINGATNTVAGTVTLAAGSVPVFLVYDPANGDMYVPTGTTQSIDVIDATSDAIVDTVATTFNPEESALDTANGYLYVADISASANELQALDTRTNTLVGTVGLGTTAYGVAYDSSNGRLYGSGFGNGDLFTVRTLSSVSLPSSMSADVGQSVLLSASLTGQGSGGDRVSLSVSPAAGFTCIADPYGYANLSAGCLAETPGSYQLYFQLTDSNGFTVSTGTLTLVVDPALGGASVSVSRLALDVGQTTALSASVSGGAGSYAYAWSTLPTGCSVGDVGAFSCVPSGAGSFAVALIVTDGNGASTSAGTTLSVSLDPTISPPTGTLTRLDVGSSTVLAATATPGSGGDVYAWSGLPTPCLSSNALSIVCAPSASGEGTFDVTVSVVDSNGWNVTSGPLTIEVDPPLGISSFTESRPALDVGQTVVFAVSPTGGSGVYTYTWGAIPAGCARVDAATLTCVPTGSGSTTVSVSVGDTNGASLPSAGLAVVVSADPAVSSPGASTSSLDMGQSTSLSTVVSPGSGTDVLSWAGLPAGCLSSNANPVSCAPSASGTFTVTVAVRDSNGMNVSSGPLTLVVSPALSAVALTASPGALDVGQSLTFSASVSGGSGVYVWSWATLPTGCAGANAATLTCSPTAAGSYSAQATATDSNGASSSHSAAIVVSAAVTVGSISATRWDLDVSQSSTLTATVAGGSPSFAYAWAGLPAGCLSSNALSLSCSPTASGTFALTFSARDSNGMNVSSTTMAMVVSPALGTPSITASTPNLDVGQTVSFLAAESGGTGSYSYSWTYNGIRADLVGCTGQATASLTCTPTSSGVPNIVVTVSDSNAAPPQTRSTTVTVSADPTVQPITGSRTTLDLGQSTLLSTTSAQGSGGPTYAWAGLPAGCLSSNALSITCAPAGAGTFSVTVSVRDSNGVNVSSIPLTLIVSPAMGSAALAAAPSALDVGETTTLSSSASGGTGVYVYAYSGLPTGCSSANSATLACSPSAAGTFPSVALTVTDGNGATATAMIPIAVSAAPVAGTPAASKPSLDVGQTTSISALASGGSGGDVYSWSGLPTGCLSQNLLSLTCTPTVAGTFSVRLSVLDSNRMNVTSGTLTLAISPALAGALLTASRSLLDVGQTTLFAASASGGAGGDTFAWSGLPSGCSGGSSSSVTCVPAASGPFTVSIVATDANGATASANVALTVSSDPSVSVPSSSRSSLDVGQSTSLSSVATPGSGTPVYAWSGLPTGCLSANALTLSCAPTGAGTFVVRVTVQDSNGMNVSSGTLTLLVSTALGTPSLSASTATLDVGQSVTFTATEAGGSGTYTFTWTWAGNPASSEGCTGGNAATIVCTPTFSQSPSVVVSVSDSNGMGGLVASTSVVVSADPTVTSPGATRLALDIGQSTVLSATATTGSGGPTYAWSGLPTGCLSANALTVTCSPTAVGTYSVSISVRDSNGMNVSSTTLTLVVSPALGAVGLSASSYNLDVGQSTTFSVSVSGGTGSYTYTWGSLPSGCVGSSTPTLLCAPSGAGSTTVVVSVADTNGVLSGSGPVTVIVQAPPSVTSLGATRLDLDVGQSTTLTAAATAGSGGPVYAWSGLPTGCLSSNALSVTCSPTAPGTFTAVFSVRDSNRMNVSSGALTLVVSPAFGTATLSGSRLALDAGQTVLLTTSVSGGSGGDSYAWSSLPTGCGGANSATLSCVPSGAGTPTVSVTVTDSNGATASATLPLTVSSAPTISLPTASRTALDVGQSTTLSATATSGSGSPVYAWSGLPAGCLSSNALSVTCTPSGSGTFSVAVSVVDSNGMNVSSGPLTLAVSPALGSATLSASRSALDVGQFTALSGAVSGGTGSYTYSWGSLPSGCSGSNAVAIVCSPTAAGTFSVALTITDTNGASATPAPVSLAVSAAPSVGSLGATRLDLDVGQLTTLAGTATGGSGGDAYAWVGLPTGCLSSNSPSVACSPTAAGTFSIALSVIDSNGMNVSSPSLLLSVSPALAAAALSAGRSALDVGQATTLSASASGGSGGLSYSWSGLPTGCSSGGRASFACAPTSPGTSSVSVVITDSNGASVSASTTLTVSSAPWAGSPTASPSALDVGQTTALAATAGAGSGSPTYAWGGLPAGCLSVSSLILTCSPMSWGSFTVVLSVVDSNGMNVSSAPLLLPISPALAGATLSASPGALDVGQSTALSFSVFGGSGGLTYAWSGLPAGCAGGNSATLLCSPTASGTGLATVRATDANGASVSASVSLTVSAALSVAAPSASPSAADAQQAVTLSALASGGAGTLVYAWWGLPSGCLSSNLATLPCTPAAPGRFMVGYSVLDANGENVSSPALSFSVSAALSTPVLAASLTALDLGEGTTIAATVAGGSSPLAYAWAGLPTGCTGSDTPTLACAPSLTGTFSVSLRVSDANGGTATSAALTLTVSAAPTVGIPMATLTSLDLGQTTSLTVPSTPGSGGLVLNWSGLPTGCPASGLPSCTPTATGTFSIWVSAKDSNGVTVVGAPLVLTVDGALAAVTLTASSKDVDAGSEVTLTAEVSGGSGGYAYSWSALPTGCAGADVATLLCSPSAAGSFAAAVQVSDTNGATSSASVSITVNAPLSVALSDSPTSASNGATLTFTASAAGGSSPTVYAWSLNGTAQAGATGSTFTIAGAHAGTYSVSVAVSDATGSRAIAPTVSVTVSPPVPPASTPPAPTLSPSSFASESNLLVGLLAILVALAVAILLMQALGRRSRPPASGVAGKARPPRPRARPAVLETPPASPEGVATPPPPSPVAGGEAEPVSGTGPETYSEDGEA